MKMKKVAYPYIIWMVIFIVIPLLLIMYFAFTRGDSQNFSTFQFSLDNFKRFFTPTYLKVLGRSVNLAFISTVICLILGYPMAFIISKEKIRKRNIMILMFVIPMWMNFLLRTYAWLTLLGRNGFINFLVTKLGFKPLELMYNDKAVLLGMVYNFLPFMVLPIYSILTKIDNSLIEAAEDLGANKVKVFRKVILPLSIPGIITGITMVFIPAVSTFIISSLLGGNKYNLIGNLVEQQFRWTGDWHFGSSMSIILMVFILITMALTSKFDKEKEGGGGGLW
ncbi:spermidine/putrescine transport system permease protein [Tissierella praeacuta DSM 18095]|uniref:Spermidine/putrescine transport system permease protein n=1 Tax=Tissierella praeacuta DSM 18095 TaxID=1123404 RepID=A0A1M4ZKB2_9FIRM|nr:ABC transporter permease [Tissierella praeacuta]SHF18408.1 spermidine/putrescine transport system permease protein [Tissierella praeacuta DSM 18095]SUP00680.1 Spermidine/putrescine transport system permease protein PotB [Tissierella praeacuta]